jgi:hypothetical protein
MSGAGAGVADLAPAGPFEEAPEMGEGLLDVVSLVFMLCAASSPSVMTSIRKLT